MNGRWWRYWDRGVFVVAVLMIALNLGSYVESDTGREDLLYGSLVIYWSLLAYYWFPPRRRRRVVREATRGQVREVAPNMQFGPPGGEPCEKCPHDWDSHILSTGHNPIDGGIFHCPVKGCGCWGTWSLTNAEALKEMRKRHE